MFLGKACTQIFDFRRIPEAVQDDIGAVLGEGGGNAQADATGRSGNDGGLA